LPQNNGPIIKITFLVSYFSYWLNFNIKWLGCRRNSKKRATATVQTLKQFAMPVSIIKDATTILEMDRLACWNYGG